jgi:hypothetical protein
MELLVLHSTHWSSALMRSRFSLVALAVAATLPSTASAVDFSYSGFSTAAYAQTDTDKANVGYVGQPDGINSDGSFETDSKIGVQMTATLNDYVSTTVQGVAYADLSGDWEPRLDWAYVRVRALQSLSFRAGYLRAPTFMYSDSVFVGYSNVWVRPPLEVYNLSPVYQIRGFDATWRTTVGPLQVAVNPYYGDSEVDIPEGTIDVPEWVGLATTVEYGSFLVRAGYSEVDIGAGPVSALTPLIATLRGIPSSVCSVCATEADRLDVDGTQIHNINVGVQFDDGTNFVATEFAQARSGEDYLIRSKSSGYATYGRRFGNVMPYLSYAILRRDDKAQSSAIPAVGPFAALNAAVNGVIASNGDQDSFGAGVRYELPAFSVLQGALVKLQFDHIDAKNGNGILNQVQPGFDGKLNMISASLDFIF